MAHLKSGLNLEEGENLVMEIEAELWATSSNPIAIFFGKASKFLAKLLGFRKNGFVVITDRRVIEVANTFTCYCFNVGKTIKYLLPSSIKEIGYEKITTCGCCCPAYNLYYESFTQKTSVLLPGADDATAQKTVDAFYKAIFSVQ
jgi:hypothetical protein